MSFIYNTCIKYTYHTWSMPISKVKCIVLKSLQPTFGAPCVPANTGCQLVKWPCVYDS